jgi:hypothetical protein
MPLNDKEDIPFSERLGWSIKHTSKTLGVCAATTYNLIRAKKLATYKVGRRTFVLPESARAIAKSTEAV